MNVKQIVITDPMEKPFFRYVPDKVTLQRLVRRVVAMDEDFAGFAPFVDKDKVELF